MQFSTFLLIIVVLSAICMVAYICMSGVRTTRESTHYATVHGIANGAAYGAADSVDSSPWGVGGAAALPQLSRESLPPSRSGAPPRHFRVKDLGQHPASKAEDIVRRELRLLTGFDFPTVYPPWLRGMELDGYSEELSTAFEYQGPQHTKFDKRYDATYAKYLARVRNDRFKRSECPKHGVSLLVVDYILPRHLLNTYLRSRLYDASRYNPKLAAFAVKPPGYMEPIRHTAYEATNQTRQHRKPASDRVR